MQAARRLFWRRGINVTGIVELCAAAHVSKRTLYHHFSGKDEVVVAYLSELENDPGHAPAATLRRTDLTPRARLLELFVTLTEGERPLRGCPFLNAAVEVADPASQVHRQVVAYKGRFTERLSDLARAAGARDPERVGRRLALLYDGAAAEIVVADSAEPATEAQALAAAILRDAID